ncbi:denticleless protein homolog [Gadus morhua]|uniref:Denticleless E3 ubiquitin n=1 Tax=Gadus morhua TaxID=8049 RepID=A0A8C5BWV4_GADMO|nr:denticleless protein homolog [Gadus morhua]
MLFRSLVDRGVYRKRHNVPSPRYPLTSLLEGYQCARHDEHISYGNMGVPVPPFGLEFSSVKGMERVLAVANEEGIVRLYNTERCENPILKEWMAHENAVFDIAWVPGESSVVTASGDQMAKLWDVHSGELLGTFKGHQCSLKSVAFSKREKAVFCTGGRDGQIMVWDTRCSKKDGFYRQVKQISGAHNKSERHTPSQLKKRRPSVRSMANGLHSQQSVTVVLFQDEHTLISSGAVDGVIKMWDLRKSYTAHHHDPVPLQTYPYPGSSTRKLGYSGLVLDSTGSNLISNCTDDNIYMFNVSGMKTSPVAVFSGHLNSSFYVKSTISPDDQFLASGSSDHQTYIWKLSDPKRPPMLLQGHSQEVTSITWSPTDFTKIATCSDDNTVRIWRLDRGIDGNKSTVGQANLVGWACPKTPSTGLNKSSPNTAIQEMSTPAKTPNTDRMEGLASPQLAACAPSGANMPPSSSTAGMPPSSSSTRDPKANALGQRTPTSIKSWLARSPGSPAASPTPRQTLSPCPQPGTPRSAPASERRAKRRLDTGEGALGSCGGAGPCECVAELYPTSKRSRPLMGVCCPAACSQDPEPQAGAEPPSESCARRAAAPNQAPGKENCSPVQGDWLSMMGERLKNGLGSPRSPRSPRSAKKQDGRTPVSPIQQSPQNGKKISSYFQRRTVD